MAIGMRKLPSPWFGVLAKVLAASCLLLVALGGIVWAAVDTSRGTADEGEIAGVFAERVTTDRARLLAAQNSALVAERLSASDRGQIAKLNRELATSDAQLTTALAPALGGDDIVTSIEARTVADIRAAFPVYLECASAFCTRTAVPDRPRSRRSTPNWIKACSRC